MLLVIQELSMSQISSLKILNYHTHSNTVTFGKVPFVFFSGAERCLRNVSGFKCSSDVDPNHPLRLSQICHKIRSLVVIFCDDASAELNDLIHSQKSLKSLGL